MCRYCKRLEELRTVERKSYDRTVNSWKNHCDKLEQLLKRCLPIIYVIEFFGFDGHAFFGKDDLISEINEVLRKVKVGSKGGDCNEKNSRTA